MSVIQHLYDILNPNKPMPWIGTNGAAHTLPAKDAACIAKNGYAFGSQGPISAGNYRAIALFNPAASGKNLVFTAITSKDHITSGTEVAGTGNIDLRMMANEPTQTGWLKVTGGAADTNRFLGESNGAVADFYVWTATTIATSDQILTLGNGAYKNQYCEGGVFIAPPGYSIMLHTETVDQGFFGAFEWYEVDV